MSQMVDKSNPMPRYLQVRTLLEQMIRSGEIPLGGKVPSERDLAKGLDVSQMTVNKAVALLVREGWLRRELGNGTYVNENLQVPAPTDVTIGFAIPMLATAIDEDFFVSALLKGVQKASIDRPISLRIFDAHARSLSDTIANSDLDGFIVVDLLDENRAGIEKCVEQGKRILILGASDDTVDAPFVDGDNRSGTAQAVDHLVSLGHTRIVGLFALMETWNSKERHKSFVDSLGRHGLNTGELVILDEGNGRQLEAGTERKVAELLQHQDRPTAVLCGGFFLALGAMHLIRSLGLRIPEDVSVVGYDDPASARYLAPPLTTVRQPLEEMGEQSVIHLYDWIHYGVVPPKRMIHKEALVIRSSTTQVQGRGKSDSHSEDLTCSQNKTAMPLP
ncbi:MAG TPA: GntR family transcriptional regulator [Fimbriimonas sp.]|nr:GntR family transcriptional regulator [Fimbriimonas sp.]